MFDRCVLWLWMSNKNLEIPQESFVLFLNLKSPPVPLVTETQLLVTKLLLTRTEWSPICQP